MIKKIFYGWWIVLACSLIGLYVAGTVAFGFTAFFEPIREEFGWSYTQISLAASLRGLEMGIFAPLVGFLADRFGPRKLMLWGTITVGFGLILLSLTQSIAMFYGSFLLIALVTWK
jgi:OFA family oxalate/formate antiporter-like MFS transporter